METGAEIQARYTKKASRLKAAAHPLRLQLLGLLAGIKEMSVGGLEDQLELPQADISHHLAILRRAGLVQAQRDGTAVFYRLTDETWVKQLQKL